MNQHRPASKIVKDLENSLQSVSELLLELEHAAISGERSGAVFPLSELSNLVHQEIKAQRTDKGTIAALSDIHPNTLGRILKDLEKTNPKLNTLRKILACIGLNLFVGRVEKNA